MRKWVRLFSLSFGAVGVLFFFASQALSQAPAAPQGGYPSASVTLVAGFPPGAATDATARILAQRLSEQFGGNVIVENKPGASGNLANGYVARAKPDGYTLLFNTVSLILSPALGEKTDYDAFKDLVPISLVASAPLLLVVNPNVANNMNDFIAAAKAQPGKLAYGSGTGNINHLVTLLFMQTFGISGLHVPYNGAAPVMVDLSANRLQFAIVDFTSSLPLIKSNRVIALALTGRSRSAVLPNVPTIGETMPGFEAGNWYSAMGPANTPPAIVNKLSTEIVKAMQDPGVKAKLAQLSIEPIGSTAEEFSTYIKRDFERWIKVIKTANLKAN